MRNFAHLRCETDRHRLVVPEERFSLLVFRLARELQFVKPPSGRSAAKATLHGHHTVANAAIDAMMFDAEFDEGFFHTVGGLVVMLSTGWRCSTYLCCACVYVSFVHLFGSCCMRGGCLYAFKMR